MRYRCRLTQGVHLPKCRDSLQGSGGGILRAHRDLRARLGSSQRVRSFTTWRSSPVEGHNLPGPLQRYRGLARKRHAGHQAAGCSGTPRARGLLHHRTRGSRPPGAAPPWQPTQSANLRKRGLCAAGFWCSILLSRNRVRRNKLTVAGDCSGLFVAVLLSSWRSAL